MLEIYYEQDIQRLLLLRSWHSFGGKQKTNQVLDSGKSCGGKEKKSRTEHGSAGEESGAQNVVFHTEAGGQDTRTSEKRGEAVEANT